VLAERLVGKKPQTGLEAMAKPVSADVAKIGEGNNLPPSFSKGI
jgi:hypothetical protein